MGEGNLTSTMKQMLSVLAVATVLLSPTVTLAEMSCIECATVSRELGIFSISYAAIVNQLSIITEAVCAADGAEQHCLEDLPIFWPVMAVDLFNPELGWFSPQYMCADVCVKDLSEIRDRTCIECNTRVTERMDAMNDEATLTQLVAEFRNLGFCLQFDLLYDRCEIGLDTIIPVGLKTLSAADRAWIDDFCNSVGCTA